jgi:hypothetical protein
MKTAFIALCFPIALRILLVLVQLTILELDGIVASFLHKDISNSDLQGIITKIFEKEGPSRKFVSVKFK